MSLDFNFSGMKKYISQEEFDAFTTCPYGKITGEDKWHPVSNALVWATMAIGMPVITEENYEKFAARYAGWQKVVGASLQTHETDIYVTKVDVKRHIGLRTNASAMTDAQFLKRLGEMAMKEGDRILYAAERDGECAGDLIAAHCAKVNADKTEAVA